MSHIAHLYEVALGKHRSGLISEAIEIFETLSKMAPAESGLLLMIAMSYAQIEKYDQSIAFFDRFLAVNPDDVAAVINRAVVLKKAGRHKEAIEGFDTAAFLDESIAQIYVNKGNALFELKKITEAIENYNKAIELDPDYQDAYLNRGIALSDLNLADDAILDFDRAISLAPQDPEPYFNKALLSILHGNFAEGWELYEWRMRRSCSKHFYPNLTSLPWRGDGSLKDKKLFVYSEQGFGDIIQFCRYLTKIEALGANLIFEAPVELVSLLSTIECPMTIIKKGERIPEIDVNCPLMSLPYIFKTSVETIPAKIPYLFAEKTKVDFWRKRVGLSEKLKVGLVWSGSKQGPYRLRNRSLELEILKPILDMPIEFHSLQKECAENDLDFISRYPNLVRHEKYLEDFSDTAALIECLDLVVTVDTSVAHLAGAMGKPVWIMVRYESDFRWMLHRTDSPWYPTAKLFRQDENKDWITVVEKICQSLSNFERV